MTSLRFPFCRLLPPAAAAGLALAISVGPAFAFRPGQCLAVRNVEIFDVLFIRSRPDHRSAKVGAIAPDSLSPIVISGACVPPGEPPRRLWCPVDYHAARGDIRRGYVKAYFTEVVPCPPSLEFYRGAG